MLPIVRSLLLSWWGSKASSKLISFWLPEIKLSTRKPNMSISKSKSSRLWRKKEKMEEFGSEEQFMESFQMMILMISQQQSDYLQKTKSHRISETNVLWSLRKSKNWLTILEPRSELSFLMDTSCKGLSEQRKSLAMLSPSYKNSWRPQKENFIYLKRHRRNCTRTHLWP